MRTPSQHHKQAAIAAIAASSVLALAACGGNSTTTTSDTPASASSTGGDTLSVLVEAGGHGQLQPVADAYERETGTKVTFIELPYDGLYNRLNSEFSSGTFSFDVAALDAIWLSTFAEALSPLDSLFTSEVEADNFPALLEEAKVDGTYVGMPVWTNSEILYYRTDLFDDPIQQEKFKAEFGYDLAVPTTWEEFADAAKFFTQDLDGDGKTDLYGTDVKGAVETEWLATLSQTGEKDMVVGSDGTVSLGNANSKRALDYYVSLLPYAPPGAAQLDWGGSQNLFYQGQLAMVRFWAHAYRQIPADAEIVGKVGVAPMIGGPGGVAGVPGAWYLSIPAMGANQDKAIDFIKFAYEHNELSTTSSLGLASRISVLESLQDTEGFENYAPLVETLSAQSTIPRPAVPQWQEIVDTVLTPMIQKAVEPGADTQKLLDDAKAQVEAILR